MRNEAQYDYSTADYFERYQPARPARYEPDVLVPFLQAVITGAFVAVALGIGAGVVAHWQSWPWWYALAAAGGGWLLVAALTWSQLLADSRDLLRKVETWSNRDNRDLDGDGEIGEPKDTPARTVRLEVEQRGDGNQRSSFFHDLPTEPALFTTWASAAVNGQSLALSHWTGNGRPFARSDYEALLDFMQRAGVVTWINPDAPAQGRQITKPGKAALQAWLEGEL